MNEQQKNSHRLLLIYFDLQMQNEQKEYLERDLEQLNIKIESLIKEQDILLKKLESVDESN